MSHLNALFFEKKSHLKAVPNDKNFPQLLCFSSCLYELKTFILISQLNLIFVSIPLTKNVDNP